MNFLTILFILVQMHRGKKIFYPISIFSTHAGLPSPFYIYIAASKMANSYKIICPPINAGLWIQYYIKRFSLPEVRQMMIGSNQSIEIEARMQTTGEKIKLFLFFFISV